MPALQEINGVPLKITDPAAREKEKNIRKVLSKMWAFAGTYRIVTDDQMDEENVWYINDEVGCAMRHSDKPNFAMHPFIYAPNHVMDGHTITYSVSFI
jgi:tubulin--tyrosine ligase-like protein 12